MTLKNEKHLKTRAMKEKSFMAHALLPAGAALSAVAVFFCASVTLARASSDTSTSNEYPEFYTALGSDLSSASYDGQTTLTGAAGFQQACAMLQQQGLAAWQDHMGASLQQGSLVGEQGNSALMAALRSSCASLSGGDAGMSVSRRQSWGSRQINTFRCPDGRAWMHIRKSV